MEAGDVEDPHECRACHEEPEVHAERFGFNCSRCHTLDAWKPALLLRHTFALDHGDKGQVACQTCHTTTYFENTCYGCHDHEVADMKAVHEAEGISELEPCSECHPTGVSGEAERLGYGLGGRTSAIEAPGPNADGELPGGGAEIAPLGEEDAERAAPGGQEQAPAQPSGSNGGPPADPSHGG
jgi:hypothetical protein